MTVVLGFADMLSRDLQLSAEARRDLKLIHQAALRSAAITAQLLAFGRKQIFVPQALDLSIIIRDFEPVLMQTLAPKNIHLELTLSTTPVLVLADRGQLEQLLLNLVCNARDATPDAGQINVETGETVLTSDAFLPQEVAVRAGHYIVLTVRDSGCGMSPDILAHIFDPFFTTKPVGEGTGLGLSTVYGIVKQSNGYIWAASEVGRGSTFQVYLPSAVGSQRLDTPGERPATACRRHTVLIVDDESGVRAMMNRALTEAGFAVVEAEDGDEAIELLRGGGQLPDAVITDLVMERMDGKELARRIADEFSGMPVLFTSGSTNHNVAHLGSLTQDPPFLQKPFSATDLVDGVRAIISERPSRVDGTKS
jgi:two-component system, cell cycle sensor histidine kinase and response regulator CckA